MKRNGVYGLIGEKLGHSYSPQIHALLGDYDYNLFEMPESEVGEFLKKREFNAVNVTIPYKKTVMQFLDEIDENALKIGSVNTIVKTDGSRLIGRNTDYFGFKYMLESAGIDVKEKKVLVLGNGGASATVQCVLNDLGAGKVVVVSRSGDINYSSIGRYSDFEVIINATPVGMYPNNLKTLVCLDDFANLTAVADLIYNPSETKLLLDARKKGVKTVNGLTMLAAQAKKAAEYFFNESIDDSVTDKIVKRLSFEMKNILLVGMPGCGKTTVGKALAKIYSRNFIDTDDVICQRENREIPEIFASEGADYFRKIESQVLFDVTKEKGLVIATGGGSVIKSENHDALKQNSTVVFIKRDLDILPRDGRPLSQKSDLKKMYEERLPLYEKVADFEVTATGTSEQTAEKIAEILGGVRRS